MTMKIEDPENKTRLIKRLRRIEGQLRGLQGMLEEERDCREILQQLSAVSSAVRSASRSFFEDYASLCLAEMGREPGDLHQQLLLEMVELLDKTP
jgi:DNA-binding FrmR family transcriptional regulator